MFHKTLREYLIIDEWWIFDRREGDLIFLRKLDGRKHVVDLTIERQKRYPNLALLALGEE